MSVIAALYSSSGGYEGAVHHFRWPVASLEIPGTREGSLVVAVEGSVGSQAVLAAGPGRGSDVLLVHCSLVAGLVFGRRLVKARSAPVRVRFGDLRGVLLSSLLGQDLWGCSPGWGLFGAQICWEGVVAQSLFPFLCPLLALVLSLCRGLAHGHGLSLFLGHGLHVRGLGSQISGRVLLLPIGQ